METIKISSRQNPLFKEIQVLEKAKERRTHQLFVLEGIKELELAIEGGYDVVKIIYPDDINPTILQKSNIKALDKVVFARGLFDELCCRKGGDNVIALAKPLTHSIEAVKLPDNPLVLVIEAVEKPGNLGAILRTADAVGVDLVMVCDMSTDLYNPNVIRSSVGCLFTNKIVVTDSAKAKELLIREKFNIFTTYLQTNNSHFSCDYTEKTALIFGTEATGVSPIWLTEEIKKVKIPMRGKIDSMNVSNSVAVLLYEALRQRINK